MIIKRNTKKSDAAYVTYGYGQVEPNRLKGIVDAYMESQAPAYTKNSEDKWEPIDVLENGTFLCVIPAPTGVGTEKVVAPMGRIAVFPKDAPATAVPYMVFSERKQYDEREVYSDFADRAIDKVDGILYPRLVGMTPDNDVFTTNLINSADLSTVASCVIGDDGILIAKNTNDEPTNKNFEFAIVKRYTMPDGQPGVKFMCQKYVEASTPTPTKYFAE